MMTTTAAENAGTVQAFKDDCEMYEGNQRGIISMADFRTVLADAGVQLTPLELKFVTKHFGVKTSSGRPSVNHNVIAEALESDDFLEVICWDPCCMSVLSVFYV